MINIPYFMFYRFKLNCKKSKKNPMYKSGAECGAKRIKVGIAYYDFSKNSLSSMLLLLISYFFQFTYYSRGEVSFHSELNSQF